MTDESQIQLIEAVLAGDIESFGPLAQRYYAALTAIGYSILADHSLAEDAAQETLARALVKLRQLKTSAKFGAWLASICRNVAKDMAAGRSKMASTEGMLPAAAKESGPDHSEIVNKAMEQLSPADRELIALRYYNEMSYQQIGSVLGVTRTAINGRLTRVKRKLAKYLKRNDLGEYEL